MRKLLRLSLAGGATVLVLLFMLIAYVFAGPVSSGAIFLLIPAGTTSRPESPEPYEPLHKGHVDLSTGEYTREDDDLVVTGTPPLVLRRTYYSGWRSSRPFGINTTHTGEAYLVGDPKAFQWAALILASGHRIDFSRTSPGNWFMNAMFQHRGGRRPYQGAVIGWTGLGWTMGMPDGSRASFQSCGRGGRELCSVLQTRDAEGHAIHYRRTLSGRLVRMEASADRWIGFDYDDGERITRAYDSTGREVRYAYDERRRLSRVTTFDGKTREYTYTDRDEMRTVTEPGIFLENTYDAAGRCIRQVNRFASEPKPYTFEMNYRVDGEAITQTEETQSDGTWSKYTFDASRNVIAESWGEHGKELARVSYDRDSVSNLVVALTVTCADRAGRQAAHFSRVQPGYDEWTRWDLYKTHCTWSDWIKGRQAKRLDREPR